MLGKILIYKFIRHIRTLSSRCRRQKMRHSPAAARLRKKPMRRQSRNSSNLFILAQKAQKVNTSGRRSSAASEIYCSQKRACPPFHPKITSANAAPQSFAFSKIPTVQRVTDRHATFEKPFFVWHPKSIPQNHRIAPCRAVSSAYISARRSAARRHSRAAW